MLLSDLLQPRWRQKPPPPAWWAQLEALRAGRPQPARDWSLWELARGEREWALALWADAARAMLLDEDRSEALRRLAALVPGQGEIWLELGRALANGSAADWDQAARAWSRAAEPSSSPATRGAAALALLERELDCDAVAGAARWAAIVELNLPLLPGAEFRLAELALARGDLARARRGLASRPAPLDFRGWWMVARTATGRDAKLARFAWHRALLLCPSAGFGRFMLSLAAAADAALWGEVRLWLDDLSERPEPWEFARRLTANEVGSHALDQAPAHLRPRALLIFVEACLRAGRVEVLGEAVGSWGRSFPRLRTHPLLVDARRALAFGGVIGGPSELRRLAFPVLGREWAVGRCRELYASWLADREFSWLFEELEQSATALGCRELAAQLPVLEALLETPTSVVVLGEFNAGKSSLVNALVGQAVARVGVVPTTDRLQTVALPGYTLIDTPGFNAPGSPWVALAESWQPLADAHLVLWVADATQPLRGSELRGLSGLSEQGVPVLLALNKCDRVPEPELDEVFEHVRSELEGHGIELYAEAMKLAAVAGSGVAELGSVIEGVAGSELVARLVRRRTLALLTTAALSSALKLGPERGDAGNARLRLCALRAALAETTGAVANRATLSPRT